jgi:hypothetical protein
MKQVMMAAPPQVVEEATVVRMENGTMQTLRHTAPHQAIE